MTIVIIFAMWRQAPRLRKPGLFVTGTDTGVGKTAVACAIAAALRRQLSGARVGVCKPVASGCRKEREGLVSDDAEALAHFADCRLPLDVINPVRYAAALSPAAAAEKTGVDVDFDLIAESLRRIDEASDVVLVEGVGGLLVPLDARGRWTVLDLAVALGYPVLIVARSGLGTVNHTAMTARLLRDAGCRVGGVVMNQYTVDVQGQSDDPSLASNRLWIERVAKTKVLATVPQCPAQQTRPERGLLPADLFDAVALCYWPDVLGQAIVT